MSLEGLSVGDAFGEQFLEAGPASKIKFFEREVPRNKRWHWTDDTAMAVSIYETLVKKRRIDPDFLAQAFVVRYAKDPARGYGRGAHEILSEIAAGTSWDIAAKAAFKGQGSHGNGGGMRSAPIGAAFAGDVERIVENASMSAAPTHAHPDGVAGAIAVALAAGAIFAGERDAGAIVAAAIAHTPPGATRDGLVRASKMLGADHVTVAAEVGNGSRVLASDTVPFAVWCAAKYAATADYAGALWACTDVGGDVDTTCAMVGGMVVGASGLDGIPADWRAAREDLPRV